MHWGFRPQPHCHLHHHQALDPLGPCLTASQNALPTCCQYLGSKWARVRYSCPRSLLATMTLLYHHFCLDHIWFSDVVSLVIQCLSVPVQLRLNGQQCNNLQASQLRAQHLTSSSNSAPKLRVETETLHVHSIACSQHCMVCTACPHSRHSGMPISAAHGWKPFICSRS